MDEWMNERTDREVDDLMDGWMYGWMDREFWMDR
jgi:hypothetical protein